MKSVIPHNRPTLGDEEIQAAANVIARGMLAQGEEVENFENEICRYLGYEEGHAVAVSSGSAALYMALRAKCDGKRIKKVAIPAYSCSALKNAVVLAGKEPVYVDTAEDSANIDLMSEKVISSDITIACHMYGTPVEINPQASNNVIEDCAQSMGATIQGIKTGTQTDISIFSFYATKPITSGGEGGMVVAKDKAVADYIKDLRDFDMKNDNRLRFNLQMTDLQAAIGRVQLRRLDSFIERRRVLADRYEEYGISLWNRRRGGMDYRGLIKSENPYQLIEFLKSNRIRAIVPIEENELLCESKYVPNAHILTQLLVSLPLYPSLCDDEQEWIIAVLHRYREREGHL